MLGMASLQEEPVLVGLKLASHAYPGLVLALLGTRHVLCCLIAVAKLALGSEAQEHRGLYTARAYHRGAGSYKYAELWFWVGAWGLYSVTYGAVLLVTQWPVNVQDLQHMLVALCCTLYGALTFAAEMNRKWLPLPPGTLHGLMAFVFLVQFLVFGLHGHSGLEHSVHAFFAAATGAFVALKFLQVGYQNAALLDVGAAMALVLQGTWFIQIPFLVTVPSTSFSGCKPGFDETSHLLLVPQCTSEDSEHRAQGFITLLFGVHIMAIVLGTFGLYVAVVSFYSKKSKGFYTGLKKDTPKWAPLEHL